MAADWVGAIGLEIVDDVSGQLAAPPGTVPGHLLVAFLAHHGANPAISGFQLAGETPFGGPDGVYTISCFWRWVTGSEPAEYLATWTNPSNVSWHMVNLQGLSGIGDPVTGFAYSSPTAGFPTAPSIEVTRLGGFLFGCFTASEVGIEAFTPGGMELLAHGNLHLTHTTVGERFPARAPSGDRTVPFPPPVDGFNIGFTVHFADGNAPPNAPILLTPGNNVTIDVDQQRAFTWQFSDPNPADTQAARELRYRVVGTTTWTTTGRVETPALQLVLPAGTFTPDRTYEWQVRTWDQSNTDGAWSGTFSFFAAQQPPGPTIDSPAAGSVISESPLSVTWSTPRQAAWRVRVVADSGGAPNDAIVLYDSGVRGEQTTRAHSVPVDAAWNETFVHVQVHTVVDGFQSPWSSAQLLVSFTPPAIPQFTAAYNVTAGAIRIVVLEPEDDETPGATWEEVEGTWTTVEGTWSTI